jgi:hypothetical protein
MIALDTLPAAARLAFEGLQSENARLQSEHLRLRASWNSRTSKSGC